MPISESISALNSSCASMPELFTGIYQPASGLRPPSQYCIIVMTRSRLHQVRVKDSMGGRANIDVRPALGTRLDAELLPFLDVLAAHEGLFPWTRNDNFIHSTSASISCSSSTAWLPTN